MESSANPMHTADVAVIILTLNEATNLPFAIASVQGWAREIIVVDSLSTDATVEIARKNGCTVLTNPFVNFARQRNFALASAPIESTWILFLDADEWLTQELKDEISGVLRNERPEAGFFLKPRMIWMGTWIRRGYYPTWILRMFRRGAGRVEDRSINERVIVDGKIGYLENDFVHEDRRGIDDWIRKHNEYATREAIELIKFDEGGSQEEIQAHLFGSQAERKRWLRHRVWNRLPPLVRPFIYFMYRLVLRGGFLDGRHAFIYHFLQALWFQFLIDAKYIEMRRNRSAGANDVASGSSD